MSCLLPLDICVLGKLPELDILFILNIRYSVQPVSFTDDEGLVGESTKNTFHSNPTNPVFHIKHLIGCKIDEADIEKDTKHWSFGVADKGGIRESHFGLPPASLP